jgi:hypothetical protein
MEGIARLVETSMARHGLELPFDPGRLRWSPWFRCDASFDFRLIPSAAGIYTVAEEIVPAGQAVLAGGKRMLAVLHVAETEDLCLALARHMAPHDPWRARLWSGHCFVRFAKVADASNRTAACSALQQWLAAAAQATSGLGGELLTAPDNATFATKPHKPEEQLTEMKAPAFPAGF